MNRLLLAAACCGCIGVLPVVAQSTFVDATGRQVPLPPRVGRVLAAGFPAEVLLHTLAPETLVARNRLPDARTTEFLPPAFRQPTLIRQLPELDNPAADAEAVALRPDLIVDYGTVSQDYTDVLDAVTRRTGIPGVLLDGSLERIPQAYRDLGPVLNAQARGSRLALASERILNAHRSRVAALPAPPRVYLSCSADGLLPCLSGDSGGEQLDWLGATNVAGTRAAAPRRAITPDDVAGYRPDVVIAMGPDGTAARLRSDPDWRRVPAVAAGRVLQFPNLPYSWGPRPPSVNRLVGLIWLSYVLTNRPLDGSFREEVRRFFDDFYQVPLTDAQMDALMDSGRTM